MPFYAHRYLAAALLLAIAPLAFAQGDVESGEAIFKSRCSGCHAIGPGAQPAFGPQLTGVVGRQAGGAPGYQYSDAMRASGIVWDEEKLKAYIDDAKAVVPGTRMNFWWIGSDQKLSDLVAYLASQVDKPTP